ncbi:hypothetical protein [Hespellia stercorisuis]|uniref:CGNR zinc finger domain-containing protein n=1 Tax=Hespellia stercorisuis DSM 15480 TaxID=1121950 RepID=A0A1M6LKZ7_9FIRM|nr:hypothetical protein [Hespellia stercorisuis]SHJ71874.1 hypothetical protein SAMN02745243_01201 [Hespellia stercorisuis DSM 15480]
MLAFSNNNYELDFGAKQSVELFCAYNKNSEEAYNHALISFFNKYGFFLREGQSELTTIDRTVIDSFLRLIYVINDIYELIALPSPLSSDTCNTLLKYITELTFIEFDDYRFGLKSFPLINYLNVTDYNGHEYDPNEELFYLLKNIQVAYSKQFDEYASVEKYNGGDIIVQLHDYFQQHFSKESMKIVDFFYHHIQKKEINILTNSSDGHSYLSINEFPYEKYEQEIISIADQICNYYLSQACESSPLIVKTSFKAGYYTRNLEYEVKDLANAILLSLLFFDPTKQEFRKCQLEGCNNYFLTNRSNMKKLYCCRSHTRTAATHRFRDTK